MTTDGAATASPATEGEPGGAQPGGPGAPERAQAGGDLAGDIGRRLAAHRGQRGMRVAELAREVGVTPSLISQIERGLSRPSVSTLFAIAQALDVPVDAFFREPPAGGAQAGGPPAASGADGPGEAARGRSPAGPGRAPRAPLLRRRRPRSPWSPITSRREGSAWISRSSPWGRTRGGRRCARQRT